MKPQPLIAVPSGSIEAASRWYQKLLGCDSGHGGEDYERLVFNGEIILQLHRWDAHDHPFLSDPVNKPYGNGSLLWFETEDFDEAMARAYALGAQILEEPHVNTNAKHRECWLRDPYGYVVVLASGYGDVGPG